MKGKTLLLVICGLLWVSILGFIYYDSLEDYVVQSEKMVTKFMAARLQSDLTSAEVYLTGRAKNQYAQPGLALISSSEPHFVNYKIMDTKTIKDKGGVFQAAFVVRIYEKHENIPEANTYFDEKLLIKRVNRNNYIIESVQKSSGK